MRFPGLVLLVLAVCARVAAAGNDGIVIESYTGKRPDDAGKAIAPLLRELAQRGFQTDSQVGTKFEDRVSRHAGGAADLPASFGTEVEKGTKAWASGRFEDAVGILSPLTEAARVANGAFIGNAKLRDTLLRALVVLGLSQQRLGDPAAATTAFAELIRTFPDATVARSTYGPEAAQLFEQTRKTLASEARGRLLIKLADEQTEVYIDERLERRGSTVKQLIPGDYRINAQLGAQRSRTHRVTVRPGDDITLTIDPVFDAAVHTTGWSGFAFQTAAERERLESAYAAMFAKAIDGTAVVVISVDSVRSTRAIVGSLVLLNGKEIRRASLALDPPPSSERVEALAKFLAGEKVTAGIDVELDGAIPVLTGGNSGTGTGTGTGTPAPRDTDTKPRWIGWPIITGVVAAGAIGTGAYLLSKDGTCKDGSDDPLRCPDLYENKPPGWGAIAGGAVFAGITVYLIVTRPSPAKKTQAFVAPAGDGAIAGVSGRW
ncbi:MAG: hypothetical protein H0T46_16865 [Deltaproteobacteria bacterium]|nr:hypothetical protein [Deltaproteobacteria bacterium]